MCRLMWLAQWGLRGSLLYSLRCFHVSCLYYRLWRSLKSSSLSQFCLQQCCGFADGSGFKKLHHFCMGGFMPPWEKACWWAVEGGDHVSANKNSSSCLYLHQTLHAALSPPLHPQPMCCLVTRFDRKSKAGFAVSTSQAAGVSLLGWAEMERVSRSHKSRDPVSEPLRRLLWLWVWIRFTELLALNKKVWAIWREIGALTAFCLLV